MTKIGWEMDETCNRDGCDGVMGPSEKPPSGCSCHISPPCERCVNDPLRCSKCDASAGDDFPENEQGDDTPTPKETPPMTDAKPRLFTIHLVDRGPTPDAPPDPTSAIVASMIETVNSEIERGLAAAKQIVDATTDRANEAEREIADLRHQLADALAAVEEWKAAVARWADIRDVALTERDTARAENERLRGELATNTKRLILANHDRETMVTALARANKRIEDLETREQTGADSAYAQRMTVDRLARELDTALAERDEARKALADRGGVTLGIYANACRTRDEAFAELAALRARVAELEAELAKAEKQRDENHASAREWRSFFDTVIKERDAARIEVITSKNKLTDARAALDRLI